jgi:hypothetical protein
VKRLLTGAVIVAAIASQSPEPGAQSRDLKAQSLAGDAVARAFLATRMTRGFTPPKTPWGHPDVQGNFTHMSEANTPLERPAAFATKRFEDVTPAELEAEAKARMARANRERTDHAAYLVDNAFMLSTRPWLLIDPADGKVPALLPAAKEREAARAAAVKGRGPADSYTDLSLRDRCLLNRGVPDMAIPGPYGNSLQILQTRDYVVIRKEQIHDSRIIPLDNRPLTGVRTFFGESRGRFEGNTLVVTTTNFNDQIVFYGSGPDMRTIERFTRTGPRTVEWTVTVEDAGTWARPWTFTVPLAEDDEQAPLEYACHEGNYAVPNILTGERANEKK